MFVLGYSDQKRNKYENNVKTFVILRHTRGRKVYSGWFSGEKKIKSDFYIDVFQEYELFTFFGWFFRDKKVGVPAPSARPRLINNSLPVVFNESRNTQNYRLQSARIGHKMKRNGYHCCYFCKTAADFRRSGRVATLHRRVASRFRNGAMRRKILL